MDDDESSLDNTTTTTTMENVVPRKIIKLDDGSGKNVFYIIDGIKKRKMPSDYIPERLINGDLKYYHRGPCLYCTRRNYAPLLLTLDKGAVGFSFNICEDCLLARTPNIKTLRGNGDAVYKANIDEPKNFYKNIEETTYDINRDKKLIDRCLESKYYIQLQSKQRRNETRTNVIKVKASEYGIKEGTHLSWGLHDKIFDEYYGEVDATKKIPNGHGVKFFSDGSVYVGGFVNGLFETEERGLWTRLDGSQYEGTWFAGLRHGSGTQLYPDGSQYVGEFARGNEHGHGCKDYADGSSFEGRFRFGRRDGPGLFISKNEIAEKGNFRDLATSLWVEQSPPVFEEKIELLNEEFYNPPSLYELSLNALAITMNRQRYIVPSKKITNKLCQHLKPIVAKSFFKASLSSSSELFINQASLIAFKKLDKVDMKCIKMAGPDTDTFVYFQAANNNVKEISLVSNKLHADSIDTFSKQLQTKSWSILESIDLSFNSFDMKSLSNLIVGISHTQSLLTLKLSGCSIKPNGAFAIATMLTTNKFIKVLDLSFNMIESIGGESIAASLTHNTCLTSLNLRSNNIGLVGGQAFAIAMKKNFTICFLSLVDNKVGTDSICEIAGRLRGKLSEVASSVCSQELDMPTTYRQGRFDEWDPILRATKKIKPKQIEEED